MGERKSFLLRIDAGLWEEIEKWAADELRSVNGQVEYLLKQAVARRRREEPGASPGPGGGGAGGAGAGRGGGGRPA